MTACGVVEQRYTTNSKLVRACSHPNSHQTLLRVFQYSSRGFVVTDSEGLKKSASCVRQIHFPTAYAIPRKGSRIPRVPHRQLAGAYRCLFAANASKIFPSHSNSRSGTRKYIDLNLPPLSIHGSTTPSRTENRGASQVEFRRPERILTINEGRKQITVGDPTLLCLTNHSGPSRCSVASCPLKHWFPDAFCLMMGFPSRDSWQITLCQQYPAGYHTTSSWT